MPGFANSPSGESIMWTDNVDFSGAVIPTTTVTTNGELLIGSTANPHIKVGSLTSPLGTLQIGYSSPNITVDLVGGTTGVDSFAMQTGTSPVLPNAAGLVTFNGAVVAAGTNPVRTDGTGVNTISLEVQISQALAAADATKIGLANFYSGSFSVDSTGFVTIATGGMPWTDVTGATQALSVQNGYITDRGGGVTYTLPATASLGDIIKIDGKLGLTTIAQNANQAIRMGSSISTTGAGGSVVGTNLGDCITLRCTTAGASTIWIAENWVGSFTVT
jgi:hypothetical protein